MLPSPKCSSDHSHEALLGHQNKLKSAIKIDSCTTNHRLHQAMLQQPLKLILMRLNRIKWMFWFLNPNIYVMFCVIEGKQESLNLKAKNGFEAEGRNDNYWKQ
jgi:hypothetical protein